jgi:hypothetical protein
MFDGSFVMAIVATKQRNPRACIKQQRHIEFVPKSDR